jgi:hypothetical protein
MVTTPRGADRRGGCRVDRFALAFDDERVVANAGLVLASTLAGRLGIEQIVDETVDLGARPAAARPGRKVLTLVCSALVGGDSIDDADVLRSGETQRVLGHRVMAPSTLGTFLRSFTFGHVRQFDRAFEAIVARAWAAGVGPGADPLTIDLDSTIIEVAGYGKQGASFGYTKRRGYHPILATRADTGEVLHARMRKGSAQSQRGAERFVRELMSRLPSSRRERPVVGASRFGLLEQQDDRCARSARRPVLDRRHSARERPSRNRAHSGERLATA